jgi:hypothetical protein
MMNPNFHMPENIHPELNHMKPSGFLSSNSKKMIGSAHSKESINRVSSLISPNLKLMDSGDQMPNHHQNKEMSTPKTKEVTKFNLSGQIS